MRKGFTLIETMVVISIFTLILGALAALIVFGFRSQNYTFEKSQAIDEARRVVDSMTKEVREATVAADGAYALEVANDYELVFYADIDQDDEVERVRYFINPAGGPSGQLTDTCVSFLDGGSCQITFVNFLVGGLGLNSGEIEVSVEGDLNGGSETAGVSADGIALGTLCDSGECNQCAGAYEDPTTFNVQADAADDFLQVSIQGSPQVNDICRDAPNPDYSLKAQVVFSWEEVALPEEKTIFRKGVVEPTGFPITYPADQEKITVLSRNVINEAAATPIFTYYDQNNDAVPPANRISDTTRIHFQFIVNINPSREPYDFLLDSDVQLRNLKIPL